MTNLPNLRVIARLWFMTALFSALLLSVFALDAKAADEAPRTQPGGASPEKPKKQTGGTAGEIKNPEQFVEDYSRTILEMAKEGKIGEVLGRDSEAVRTQNALEEKRRVSIIHGDAKSGKSALVIKMIIDNPKDTYFRLDLNKIYGLPSKDLQTAAVKQAMLYLEQENLKRTTGKVVLYVDNTPFLAQGHEAQVKPIDAIIEAIGADRKLSLLLEMDPATSKKYFTENDDVRSRITALEIRPPSYDALIYHLRLKKTELQRQTGIAIADEALVEAARIAQEYRASNPMESAEMFVRQASDTLFREKNAGVTEAQKINREIKVLSAERESLEQDLKFEENPAQRKRLQELDGKIGYLKNQQVEFTAPASSTEIELNLKRSELRELETKLQAAKDGRGFISAMRTSREIKDMETRVAGLTTEIRRLEKDANDLKGSVEKPVSRVGIKQIQLAAAIELKVPTSAFSVNLDEAIKSIDTIKKTVRNQNHIIDRLASALASYKENARRQEAIARRDGKEPKKKPIYSALWAGETGTGKTEMVKQLAEKLGIPESDIVRLDMTEYQHSHSDSRLISAAPGYVGYGEPGQLTGPVAERPFRVILVDEVEKAHPDVIKLFMQVLDDARLTDGKGRTVFFDKTIIIFTSNAGEQFTSMNRGQVVEFLKQSPTRLGEARIAEMSLAELRAEAVKVGLRQAWGAALIPRLNDVMCTNSHTPEVIEQILHDQFKRFAKDIRDIDGVRLTISEGAMHEMLKRYNPSEGARDVANNMARLVIQPINQMAVHKRFSTGDIVTVDFQNGQFDYVVSSNEHYVDAAKRGDLVREERLAKLRERAAARGRELRSETPHAGVRLFDADFMIRNATAKVLRGLRK